MPSTVNISLLEPDDNLLARAAEIVTAGGLIVYPTETLYGIGADGRNPRAVDAVQRVKKRKDKKPILLIVPSADVLNGLVTDVSADARRLMETFWPGPLTLVFEAVNGLPEGITQGTGTVGVRVPSSALCLNLLRMCGCPLTSTSANISGQSPPTTVEAIEQELGNGIELFLNGGTLPPSEPSTVIDVSGNVPRIVREGAVTRDAIKTILPEIQL